MANREKRPLRGIDLPTNTDLRHLDGVLFRAHADDGPILVFQIGLFIAQHLKPRTMPALPGLQRGGDIEQAIVQLNRAAFKRQKELIWLMDGSNEYKFLLTNLGYEPSF